MIKTQAEKQIDNLIEHLKAKNDPLIQPLIDSLNNETRVGLRLINAWLEKTGDIGIELSTFTYFVEQLNQKVLHQKFVYEKVDEKSVNYFLDKKWQFDDSDYSQILLLESGDLTNVFYKILLNHGDDNLFFYDDSGIYENSTYYLYMIDGRLIICYETFDENLECNNTLKVINWYKSINLKKKKSKGFG